MESANTMTQRKLRTANLAPEASLTQGPQAVAAGSSTMNAAPPSGRLTARSDP